MDKERFQRIVKEITEELKDRRSIGLLNEKTVHAVLKDYYVDRDNQEVKIKNMYADGVIGNQIYEIQTRGFDKLRCKLDFFLIDYNVCIVHPIYKSDYLVCIDPDTGEILKQRKSPKTGKIYDIFPELYKIKKYLKNDKLSIKIVLMDVDDIRYIKGESNIKVDRIPRDIVEEVELNTINDYRVFLPTNIANEFTNKEFAKLCHIRKKISGVALNILYYLGIVDRIGKNGKEYLYKINE